MTNPKPIALWAVPRSLSTAFERVFVERDDLEVLHEPFSASYYYGEDPVVVDAMTFSENPAAILAIYCERLDIPFRRDSLSWESREVEEWEMWDEWQHEAQQSTGGRRAARRAPVLPRQLQ